MRIIIIGAGPGGYETAVEAAKKGIEVTLIEAGEVGGTCLNRGCIPTKTLCRTAEILENTRRAEEFGISAGEISLDFQKVMERKNEVVAQLRSGVETLLGNKLITLVHGKAAIKDANTVTVASENSWQEYSADKIIIATGSHSASLPISGTELPGVLTSDDILELDKVPERLCIIGGGVIGLEFASIFKSFGSEVTVVEFCKDILPRFDSDLAKRLKQSLSKRGIEIITQAAVQGICKNGGCLNVIYDKKGETGEIIADKVLMAVGRRPNVEGLGLENAGVEYSQRCIAVNEFMQTSCPSIYAIGDAIGGIMLAHAATFHGRKALNHICGLQDNIDLSIVPAAVFTMPEAACVGFTEDECKDRGITVKCLKSFFRANGKAVSMGETEGFCKLIIAEKPNQEASTVLSSPCHCEEAGKPTDVAISKENLIHDQILGCHLFGPHSADIIHEIAALMNRHAAISDLQDIIHAHPTLSEVLQNAANN